MPRLLVAISAHGLGHLGQAAPVCDALWQLRPNLALTIWSALPASTLRQRISVPFTHINAPCDIGFVMHDARHVDIEASWNRYKNREANWAEALRVACSIVDDARPDLIISDVGDMPLAAGQALGIPTIAMSSLNWADMARNYFHHLPGHEAILSRMDQIYANSTLALRLTPGMSMRGQSEIVLPPVGAVSQYSRATLDRQLTRHLPQPDQPRVLIGMGGIQTRLNWQDWPIQSEWNLLLANQSDLPPDGCPERGIVNADTLRASYKWSFCDLLAASHAVICKPGYGTFVEAALAGVPVLYVLRADWPEQPVLVDWLQQYACCAALSPQVLCNGRFEQALHALLAQPAKSAPPRDGALIAAKAILESMTSLLPKNRILRG